MDMDDHYTIIQEFYNKINNVQEQATVTSIEKQERVKKPELTYNERLFFWSLDKIIQEVFRKTPPFEKKQDTYLNSEFMQKVKVLIDREIRKNCSMIIEACSQSDYMKKKIKTIDEKIEARKISLRKELANNLLSGRKKLKDLSYKIIEKKRELKMAEEKLEGLCKTISTYEMIMDIKGFEVEYPPVPTPTIKPTIEGTDIPEESGIYFIWSGQKLKYVGQSINLSRRLRLENHHKLEESDLISFVLIPKHLLLYAECFYIGAMKPTSNGGTPNRGPRVELE